MLRYFVIYFMLFTFIGKGQKKNPILTINIKKEINDSIDYKVFATGQLYRLDRISQFKGKINKDISGQLFVYKYQDGGSYPIGIGSKANNGDTLILLTWLQDKRELRTPCEKKFGSVKLNRATNTMNITSFSYDKKIKQTIKKVLSFKIIKWTLSELILKDISNPEFNRTFFFK